MTRPGLLLLAACSFEADVGENPNWIDDDGDGFAERDGDCNDAASWIAPGLDELCDGLDNDCDGAMDGEVCARQSVFLQEAVLDVLLVLDNTESMRAEQLRFIDSVGDLAAPLLGDHRDAHFGVTTTDVSHAAFAGLLRETQGTLWGDSSMGLGEAEAWLALASDVGTAGDPVEQARAAAYAAIQTQVGNEGWRRAGVDLVILVLSDEDDSSAVPSLSDFHDWLVEAPGLDRVSVHAIVSLEPQDPCGSGSEGIAHQELAALTGGLTLSICEPDYGPFLSAVGQMAVQDAVPTRFPLAGVADPATIEVIVELGDFVDTLEPGAWVYDQLASDVVLTEPPGPPPGSQVTIRYTELPLGR